MTTWPSGLREAFDSYEDALMRDDTAVLDDLFAPGQQTMRADHTGLLVGHDVISAFRSGRGGVARRTIASTEVRLLGTDDVLVVAVSRFEGGGSGVQTQVWHRWLDTSWRITAAHVTGRPRSFDASTWRVVGAPLVRGAESGPLDGVRVAVKDLFDVAGYVRGLGNPTWEASAPVASEHAAAVRALLDAGADVVGIARTDEFAYSIAGRNAHTGTPLNGAAPSRMPGGSTSGAAAAVALGMADLALGTDTAGSVRVPASYQGLWGLRTTHGAVSRGGLHPLAQTFDTVGWLGRDAAVVRDAAVASGLGAGDVPGLNGGLVVSDALVEAADLGTRTAFRGWLDASGRPVAAVKLPALIELADVLRIVQAAEAWDNDGAWVSAHRDALGPDVLGRFDVAATVTTEQVRTARARLVELRRDVRDVLGGRVLCLPTVPGPAPLRDATDDDVQATRAATLRMTSVAGVGGLPAVSAPWLEVDGAPVGVCLVGPAGSDVALLDLALAMER
ncbi:amidase [Curtobacterium sp. ZW137]|uniref:amidase n=1 Tax=Curtobacterium sp. ZW137 TaxID=2485104 RepID=UPI000F4CA429|nr:amidase [Curtobacterium sp. ZW137]ROP65622.1 Asp-tRNA(Asn)/Glu-tRNA(Gln) amidotransferase A subunit family amidase [Curtobacterium sp. ZW137]